jgi:hypothetical protein
MPTFGDKKRAVEISHEIQQNISNYLFSVSLINLGLGLLVGGGLHLMGVPNAAMWAILVALLNFVPYFGPVRGNPPAGHGGSPHLRCLVAGRSSTRLVSAASSSGGVSRHTSAARAPLHAQSGGHLRFPDLLDLALGCAGCVVVSANSRLE